MSSALRAPYRLPYRLSRKTRWRRFLRRHRNPLSRNMDPAWAGLHVRAVGVLTRAVEPPDPLDAPLEALGAADADGSGLAALTSAAPPAAMRPSASRKVATSFLGPDRTWSFRRGSAGASASGCSIGSIDIPFV